jgi:DNA-binding NtrC family response regulator
MAADSILLVDDDEIVRSTLRDFPSHKGFAVTVAGNVVAALKLIDSQRYSMLLTDLHIPGAGGGLTVVSAVRHVSPATVTILLSSSPEVEPPQMRSAHKPMTSCLTGGDISISPGNHNEVVSRAWWCAHS